MVYGNFMVCYEVILYTLVLKFMYFSIYVALHGTARVYVQNIMVFVMYKMTKKKTWYNGIR